MPELQTIARVAGFNRVPTRLYIYFLYRLKKLLPCKTVYGQQFILVLGQPYAKQGICNSWLKALPLSTACWEPVQRSEFLHLAIFDFFRKWLTILAYTEPWQIIEVLASCITFAIHFVRNNMWWLRGKKLETLTSVRCFSFVSVLIVTCDTRKVAAVKAVRNQVQMKNVSWWQIWNRAVLAHRDIGKFPGRPLKSIPLGLTFLWRRSILVLLV